ncbi:uncharacterized protein LOC143028731 [Oratosquilla oratoria]|uniref:uncharacterized protein LOC143028731 n=1 Tax=Oratosquilla oratoria TaxID=337810 RepID=UPI003F76AAA4
MASVDTRSHSRKTLCGVDYIERAELPHGMFPTAKNVIQNMLYLLWPKRTDQSQRLKDTATQLLGKSWFRNTGYSAIIHTIHTRHKKKHILKLYGEFVTLIYTRKQQQHNSF